MPRESWRRSRLGNVDLERIDQVAALLLLAVIEIQLWVGAPTVKERLLPAIGGVLFTGAVAIRRRWPLTGMLTILAALAVKTAVSHTSGALGNAVGLLPSLILVVYGVGAFAPPRRSRWVFGLTVLVSGINTWTTQGRGPSSLAASEVLVAVLPYMLGRIVRARSVHEDIERVRAEHIDALVEVKARAASLEERSRIARELHDVIAHSVSIMVIQAGGARMVMDDDPGRAKSSLHNVERAGRDALAEMRRLLGVLDRDENPRALAPQPRLDDLTALIARAEASGLTVTLSLKGKPIPVAPGLDLCAYRIVQEALTNAVKYAAPAHVQLDLRWCRESLEIEICDNGAPQRSAVTPIGGHGIAGMRERAALHGGSIWTGAGPLGGFTVRASLPLAVESAS
jgi:signal transduction histidine kinase